MTQIFTDAYVIRMLDQDNMREHTIINSLLWLKNF